MTKRFEISKFYRNPQFPATVLEKAFDVFQAGTTNVESQIETFSITRDGIRYPYGSNERQQFLTDRENAEAYQWSRSSYVKGAGDYYFSVSGGGASCLVTVVSFSEKHLRDVIGIFDTAQVPTRPTKASPLTIFVGHGRSPEWRELKDHLRDHHDYTVEHYERVPTAGGIVWDRIQAMLETSTMALLVMTGEDLVGNSKEKMRARQNVVHELGLCQGRFGIHRALALVEEGVDIPSNLAGVDFISFKHGNIKETFGAILAAIRKEFPAAY
ncbi:MAG TPA: TIR domain-containing protein [Chthoniobacterales bacterium]|nr:TIR domain-containing protein [Chthoniobacterales bacterium]